MCFFLIHASQKTIANQATHILSVEAELAAREQHIADLTAHIHHVETELTKLCLSWYGKLKSVAKKLRN